MPYRFNYYKAHAKSRPDKTITVEAMGERGAKIKAISLLHNLGWVDKSSITINDIILEITTTNRS